MNPLDVIAMPLQHVIARYEHEYGESLSQSFRIATLLELAPPLERALRAALIEDRPIPDLQSFVLNSLNARRSSSKLETDHPQKPGDVS